MGPQGPAATTPGGVQVFAAGLLIGRGLGLVDSLVYPAIVSDKGYVFRLDFNTGHLLNYLIAYSEPNCSGQAYFLHDPNFLWVARQGLVIPFGNGSSAYYIPRGSAVGSYYVQSIYDSGRTPACTSGAQTLVANLTALLPNDPSVTGVQAIYPLPITVAVP